MGHVIRGFALVIIALAVSLAHAAAPNRVALLANVRSFECYDDSDTVVTHIKCSNVTLKVRVLPVYSDIAESSLTSCTAFTNYSFIRIHIQNGHTATLTWKIVDTLNNTFSFDQNTPIVPTADSLDGSNELGNLLTKNTFSASTVEFNINYVANQYVVAHQPKINSSSGICAAADPVITNSAD